MKKSNAFLCSLLLLGGCTTGPNKIAALSDAIECELQAAFGVSDDKEVVAKDSKDWFNPDDWTVSYSITEESYLIGTASADAFKWIVPANVDRFILGSNASISRSKDLNGKLQINMNLVHLRSLKCGDPKLKITPKSKYDIAKWIHQVRQVRDKSTKEDKVHSFGYTVTVITDDNIGAGPDFADGKFFALGTLKAENKSTEIVDFAFSEIAPPPSPQAVRVTNFPSGNIPPATKPNATKAPGQLVKPGPSKSTLDQLRLSPYSIPTQNLELNNNLIYQLQGDHPDRYRRN